MRRFISHPPIRERGAEPWRGWVRARDARRKNRPPVSTGVVATITTINIKTGMATLQTEGENVYPAAGMTLKGG